jgi:putative transposase
MCRALRVSPSGYYGWLYHQPSARDRKRQIMTFAVKISHQRSHGIYGHRKIHEDLVQEHNIDCCVETVRRIMRDNGIRSRVKHKYVVTTNSNHDFKVADNILDGQFAVDQPDKVWTADITYIPTREGWLYLAAVEDLFNREIVGWATSENIDAFLVSEALRVALLRRSIGSESDILHHSDQGSQYCSDMYQELLTNNEITCSMSRKGNCWDNACMESFFGKLKNEWTKEKQYMTREEAKNDIFKYIEMFYNRQRRHEALGYVTPVEFRERYEKDHAA